MEGGKGKGRRKGRWKGRGKRDGEGERKKKGREGREREETNQQTTRYFDISNLINIRHCNTNYIDGYA